MILPVLIGLSMFLWVPMFAQTGTTKQNASNVPARNDSLFLQRLSNTRIVLKDGTQKKNCKITEIKEYWIVFEKEGSLHDMMIDKIERIEICDGTMQAVFFNEKNRPEIGYYVY